MRLNASPNIVRPISVAQIRQRPFLKHHSCGTELNFMTTVNFGDENFWKTARGIVRG